MCTRGGKEAKRLLITFQYELNRKVILEEQRAQQNIWHQT